MRKDGETEMNVIVAFVDASKKFRVHLQLQREAGGAVVRPSYFPEVIQEITLPFKKVQDRSSATYKFNSKEGLFLESDQNVSVLFL
jgi:hypothetical protein